MYSDHWCLFGARKSATDHLLLTTTMRRRELEWTVSCASIVPLYREESKSLVEGNGGSSNPIHVQTLKTRAPRRC